MAKVKDLTTRRRLRAILRVARISFKTAPVAVFVQVTGAIIDAVLPIVVTYFAALTTSALAEAFLGNVAAGHRAIYYLIITTSLGLVMAAWTSVQQYIDNIMRYKIEAAVSDEMYAHFLNFEFWRYDDKRTIDVYDKASQFARFFPYVFDRLSSIVSNLIALIVSISALFLINWAIGLILLIAVIPGLVIQFRLSRAQTNHWNSNVETRRSKSMIEWGLFQPKNIAELRINGLIPYLLKLRAQLRNKDEKVQIEFERKYVFKRFLARLVESIAEVVALLWVINQIIARTQSIGMFIYVQQVVSRAIGSASAMAYSVASIDEDLANLFDYQEFMEISEFSGGTVTLKGVPSSIKFEHVSFHYPQIDTVVLDDINLEIKKGQHVAIVGENGSGKTTLIKLLTGLYNPSNGDITLDDIKLGDYKLTTWHKYLGVLNQEYIEYNFAKAKDNVYFGDVSSPFDQKRFDDALSWSESKKFLSKLPKGVDSYLFAWMEDDDGNKGIDLSGGQWQRLALARNFYRNSPIIILDEPTSAIDALAESRIFKHLFAQADRTVVTISHRLNTVKRADKIFVLEEGKLAETGTHQELVDKRGVYYRLFESQF